MGGNSIKFSWNYTVQQEIYTSDSSPATLELFKTNWTSYQIWTRRGWYGNSCSESCKTEKLLFAPYHTQKSFCSSITSISDIGGISRGCLIFKVFESRCSVRSDGSFVYLCVQDINSCSHLLTWLLEIMNTLSSLSHDIVDW